MPRAVVRDTIYLVPLGDFHPDKSPPLAELLVRVVPSADGFLAPRVLLTTLVRCTRKRFGEAYLQMKMAVLPALPLVLSRSRPESYFQALFPEDLRPRYARLVST